VTTAACAVAERKVEAPTTDEPVAMVLTEALMEPLEKLAVHPWFAVRGAGETEWERWEIWSHGEWGRVRRSYGDPLKGPRDDVRLHGVIRGAAAAKFIECLRRESPKYEHRNTYRAWPGPNSNTYVDVMLQRCNFHADLPATAIGKDWRGIFGVSWTSGGTGVQVSTPIIGFRIGLTEGVQIHIFGLTIGIDWWPPAIIVPIGDARIGFGDR
jgi:hypothetical protein